MKVSCFLTDYFGIVFSKGRNRQYNVSNQLKFRLEMSNIHVFKQKLSLNEKKNNIRYMRYKIYEILINSI